MANSRVAVQSLSRNDLSLIASLLEESFDYYLNHNSPFFVDYLRALRTLVGLGYTAVLADNALLSIYQRHLDGFHGQQNGNFREREGAKTFIAKSVSEMISVAITSFSALEHPRYYHDFLQALHYSLFKVPRLTEDVEEGKRLLKGLTVH
jgi:hypothetical protein